MGGAWLSRTLADSWGASRMRGQQAHLPGSGGSGKLRGASYQTDPAEEGGPARGPCRGRDQGNAAQLRENPFPPRARCGWGAEPRPERPQEPGWTPRGASGRRRPASRGRARRDGRARPRGHSLSVARLRRRTCSGRMVSRASSSCSVTAAPMLSSAACRRALSRFRTPPPAFFFSSLPARSPPGPAAEPAAAALGLDPLMAPPPRWPPPPRRGYYGERGRGRAAPGGRGLGAVSGGSSPAWSGQVVVSPRVAGALAPRSSIRPPRSPQVF